MQKWIRFKFLLCCLVYFLMCASSAQAHITTCLQACKAMCSNIPIELSGIDQPYITALTATVQYAEVMKGMCSNKTCNDAADSFAKYIDHLLFPSPDPSNTAICGNTQNQDSDNCATLCAGSTVPKQGTKVQKEVSRKGIQGKPDEKRISK